MTAVLVGATPSGFRVPITDGGVCCARPVTLTPMSVIDDHGGDDDYQTAEEDDKRNGEDRQLCCTGCVLDTEYVVWNRISTNVRLS